MSLSDLSTEALAYIVNYGAVAVGLILLLAALGAPLPATVCVLATGAFIQQGVIDMWPTLPVALLCVVLGDTLSYGIGRLLRIPVQKRFGQTAAWQRAEGYFRQRGGVAVFLTRWLLTPIALPVNFVAGGSNYPPARFVGFALAGECVWLALYGGVGYAFGSQWEYVSDLISSFSGVIVGVILVLIGAWAFFQRVRSQSTTRPPSLLESDTHQ